MSAKRIAITIGDINGIGPEVVIKSIRRLRQEGSELRLCLVGPYSVLAQTAAGLGGEAETFHRGTQARPFEPGQMLSIVEPGGGGEAQLSPGRPTIVSGRIAAAAIACAAQLALAGRVDAIVTAPISKQALHLAGLPYPGHTEFLAALCKVDTPVMMLLAGAFRVALATIHVALRDVPGRLSARQLLGILEIADHDLRHRFRIDKPHIAVAGLNPHAGEGGAFGHEEIEIIAPALATAKRHGLDVDGPFPADALFSRRRKNRDYDLYLAMYHDQGLIPLKMAAHGLGVNYTCGLPIIRTSPDHGTAFDLAGRNLADERSMLEAIKLAASLAQKSDAR